MVSIIQIAFYRKYGDAGFNLRQAVQALDMLGDLTKPAVLLEVANIYQHSLSSMDPTPTRYCDENVCVKMDVI